MLTPRVHAEPREALLRSVISASGVSLPGLTSSFYVRPSLLHIPQTPLPPVLRALSPLEALLPLTPFMPLPFIRAIGGIANVRTDEQRELKHTQTRTDHLFILRLWDLYSIDLVSRLFSRPCHTDSIESALKLASHRPTLRPRRRTPRANGILELATIGSDRLGPRPERKHKNHITDISPREHLSSVRSELIRRKHGYYSG